MTNRNELIKAAELIKKYCKSVGCQGCCLDVNGEFFVGKRSTAPAYWQLPKPRRFTDEDIALAKALKAFGVENVRGTTGGAYWQDPKNGFIRRCPEGAFASLEEYEEVPLDEIIAEGSNGT